MLNPTSVNPSIPYKELVKTLWAGWGGRILSTVIKKMYFLIYFSPKKAFDTFIHNLSMLSNFMLRKMLIKHR